MNRPRFHPRTYPFRFNKQEEAGEEVELASSRGFDLPLFARRGERPVGIVRSFVSRLFHVVLRAFLALMVSGLVLLALLNFRITLYGDGCVAFDRKPTWTLDDTFRYGGSSPPPPGNPVRPPSQSAWFFDPGRTASTQPRDVSPFRDGPGAVIARSGGRLGEVTGGGPPPIVPRLVGTPPSDGPRSMGSTAAVAIIPPAPSDPKITREIPGPENDPIRAVVEAAQRKESVPAVPSAAPAAVPTLVASPVASPGGDAGTTECDRMRHRLARAVSRCESVQGRKLTRLNLFELIEGGWLDELQSCPEGGGLTLTHDASAPVVHCSIHKTPVRLASRSPRS